MLCPDVKQTAADLEPDVPGLCIRVQGLITPLDNWKPSWLEALAGAKIPGGTRAHL